MDKSEREIQRGLRAKQILDDDLVKEAFAHIDAELWRLFRDTPPKNGEDLTFIRQMLYISEKFRMFLSKAVTDGKMAELKIKEKKSLGERVKSRLRGE